MVLCMILRLVGHEYKYAIEQIMLALFPDERPNYSFDDVTGSSDPITESHLCFGAVYAQAITHMRCDGKASRGYARIKRDKLTNKLVTDRLLQRLIKQSFYRAAADFIDAPPVWGSLTGIRPARLAAAALESGMAESAAIKMLKSEYYVSPERAKLCTDAALTSIAVKQTLKPRDIAMYIGIPFCPTRCAYCSFVSNSVEKSFSLIEPFVQTLICEIDAAAAMLKELNLRVISIYIGGGTPTALPPKSLETVMLRIKTSFDLSEIREYTVEAGRPDTIDAKKLELIRRLGAGRVCVNPQSMSSDVLSAIGRRHTPDDVFSAVRLVRQSGMALNMDVIAGLPGDTPECFRHSLDTVLDFRPENVTVHTLSLKKGSRIMLEGTAVPSGAAVSEMLGYSSHRLTEGGYGPYYLYRQKFTSGGFENTGWSLPGRECIYNICMMEELCTVLAFGGGGVTKLVSPDGRIKRIFNAKYPREYILQANKMEDKLKETKIFVSGHFSA